MAEQLAQEPVEAARALWVKVIDQTRCIGCHACTTACKSENDVPVSVTRTYVKHVDVGVFPQARRAHHLPPLAKMSQKIRVAIVGASGYSGRELLRLLLRRVCC